MLFTQVDQVAGNKVLILNAKMKGDIIVRILSWRAEDVGGREEFDVMTQMHDYIIN